MGEKIVTANCKM